MNARGRDGPSRVRGCVSVCRRDGGDRAGEGGRGGAVCALKAWVSIGDVDSSYSA